MRILFVNLIQKRIINNMYLQVGQLRQADIASGQFSDRKIFVRPVVAQVWSLLSVINSNFAPSKQAINLVNTVLRS